MTSCNADSPANTLVGSANARVPVNSCLPPFRSVAFTKLSPGRLSMFRRRVSRPIKVRIDETTRVSRGLRGVLQTHKVFAPGDTDGRPCAELSVWSHDRYKCANIRRPDASDESVLRVKMYESLGRVTIFLPGDFHGIVRRLGHSGGGSISCSRAALFLRESDSLRFGGAADGTEDQVLVRTEEVLHICVAGDDPLLPRTGRVRRNNNSN